jgi:hypothetical protein
MALTIRMACDCLVSWEAADDAPICETHQERRVIRVMAPPPPRIVAVDCDASGPFVSKAHG